MLLQKKKDNDKFNKMKTENPSQGREDSANVVAKWVPDRVWQVPSRKGQRAA